MRVWKRCSFISFNKSSSTNVTWLCKSSKNSWCFPLVMHILVSSWGISDELLATTLVSLLTCYSIVNVIINWAWVTMLPRHICWTMSLCKIFVSLFETLLQHMLFCLLSCHSALQSVYIKLVLCWSHPSWIHMWHSLVFFIISSLSTSGFQLLCSSLPWSRCMIHWLCSPTSCSIHPSY